MYHENEFRNLAEQIRNENITKYFKIYDEIKNKDKAEIVFVGEFSNGKSSVLNALLALNVLPTGIGTITSKITHLQKDTINKVEYCQDTMLFEMNNAVNEINSFVANVDKKGTQDDHLYISMQDLAFNDWAIIDTPGINDKNRERELITYTYAPRADAMVFVLDAGRGFTKFEADFFADLSDTAKEKLFVVINKIDAYEELTKDDIQKMLTQQGISSEKAFIVSAKQAIEAIKTKDADLYEKSKIDVFKQALIAYVNTTESRLTVKNRKAKLMERIFDLAKTEAESKLLGFAMDEQKICEEINLLSATLEQEKNEQERLTKELSDKIKHFQDKMDKSLAGLKKKLENEFFSLNFTEQKKEYIKSGKLKETVQTFERELSEILSELELKFPNLVIESMIIEMVKKLADLTLYLKGVLEVPMVNDFINSLKHNTFGPLLKGTSEIIKKLGVVISQALSSAAEQLEPYFLALDNQVKSFINDAEASVSNGFNKYKEAQEMQINAKVEEIEAAISGYQKAYKDMTVQQKSISESINETKQYTDSLVIAYNKEVSNDYK